MALGVKGLVKKKRMLWLYNQTRIHVDEVEGLGNFLELEVGLVVSQSAVYYLINFRSQGGIERWRNPGRRNTCSPGATRGSRYSSF